MTTALGVAGAPGLTRILAAGYHGPPALTVTRALTEWTLDPWMLVLIVLLGGGYLAGVRRVRRGAADQLQRAAAHMVTDLPDGHGHDPGPERGRVTQVAEAAHHAQHGLLHQVVGVGEVPRPPGQPAAGVPAQGRKVPLNQALERILVARTHALNQYSC